MQYTKQVMNKTIRLYSCLLLSLVLLGGCSKDKKEPQVPGSDSTENTYNDGPRVTLSANSEVDLSLLGQAKQDSRVDYMTSAEGKLTLKLPAVGTKMQVHCIIKSTNPAQPTTYATLNWVRRGTSGLYYDYNQPTFPLATGSNINQGDWYIAGMIGGTLNASAGTISFAPKLMRGITDGQVTDIDAPFYFPWQRLQVVEVNGQPSLRVESTVTFKPQGTLFRHNISNDMYNAWVVSSIKIATNAFTAEGAFTFPGVGQEPSWAPKATATTYTPPQIRLGFPEQGWSYDYTLSTSTTATTAERLPAATPPTPGGGTKTMGNNQRYYISWGMPVETVPSGATPHTAIYGDMTAVSATTNATVTRSRNTEYHIFYSDLKPEKGKSYLVRSVIRRPPLAIENFAEYNLSGPQTFATYHGFLESDGSGVTTHAYYFPVPDYTVANALESFEQTNLPAGWRLPTAGEAKAVIPGLEIGVVSSDKANPTFQKEQFTIAYKPSRNAYYENYYTMHHWQTSGDESMSEQLPVRIYGLRAMTFDTRTESNLFMSAWKYEYLENISPEDEPQAPALVIRARYLGPVYGQTGSYTTTGQYADLFREIAKEEWWEQQSVPEDYEAILCLPITGYVHSGKEYLVGKHGVLMLRDIVRAGQPTAPYFRPAKMGVKTNADLFYYRATATSPYPNDAPSDYPAMNNTFYPLAEKLKLAVRPFKPHDYKKPYLVRRPRP